MNRLSTDIIVDVLDRLEQGESKDQILEQYPEAAPEIDSLLEMVAGLSDLSSRPYVSSKQSSLDNFLSQAAEMRAGRSSSVGILAGWRLLVKQVAISFAFFAVILFGLITVSQSALPGEVLYGPKRAAESLRMALTTDAESVLTLSEYYRARRLNEVRSLLRLGESAEVEFEGVVDEVSGGVVVVEGIQVVLTAGTSIRGELQPGNRVQVSGYTEDGTFYAQELLILSSNPTPIPDEQLPEPARQTPEPTSEIREEAEDQATPSATLAPVPSPSRTPTPSPTPTATTTPTPSPTREEGTDSSGSGEEEEEDDEEDNSGSGSAGSTEEPTGTPGDSSGSSTPEPEETEEPEETAEPEETDEPGGDDGTETPEPDD